LFNQSNYLFLRKANGRTTYSIPKCRCCYERIEKEVFLKHYPDKAASIEWVYNEVAKVQGNECSLTDSISAAVIGLLITPIEPASV